MKRSLAIIMLLIYTLGITGVAIASDYCCGKLKAVNIEKPFALFANQSPDNDTQGCCRHVSHVFKVHDAHQQAINAAFVPASHYVFLKTPTFQYHATPVYTFMVAHCQRAHAPPLLANKVPLYIFHSVFRV